MTISMLLMLLAFAVGPEAGQSIERNSAPVQTNARVFKIAGECYVNGVWYNPCPSQAPDPRPENPTPEILQ